MNILHITTWYPNEYDPQLGIFVKKHVQVGHDFANNLVIAIIPNDQVRKTKVQVNTGENFSEIIGYYRARKGSRWSNYRNYQRIQTLVMQALLDQNFIPDQIICHTAEKSVGIARRFFKTIPRTVVEHWSGFLDGKFEQLSDRRKKARINDINSCQNCVTVSTHLKSALEQHGVSIPIKVIPNIIEKGKLKTSFQSPPNFVVVADLIDSIKNISGVIDAFKKSNVQGSLTIIGDGPDATSLKDQAEGVNISFLGRKDNDWVLEHLSDYDVLIVNSRFETFSMITAEAILCGVPVIATKCGGPEQFIQEEKNGWLIPVEDTEMLAQTINKVENTITKLLPEQISKTLAGFLDSDAIKKALKELYT